MYIANSVCPVCAENHETPEAQGYCRCGLGDLKVRRQTEKQIGRSMMNLALIIAVIMVPIVIFLSQYHGLGTDILSLKFASAMGMTSAQSQQSLADLCARIERNDCAVDAYRNGTRRFPKELSLWLSWAKMEVKNKHLEGALDAYNGYFQNGGTDNLEHYHFAKTLQDLGHTSEAIAEYQKMLDAEPQVLQVTVAQTLVRLLIQEKRLDDALQAIQKFQSQGENGKDYLKDEMAQVQQLRKGKKTQA